MGVGQSVWTAEEIAKLHELLGQPGWTAARIGREIGKSKNAVLGRTRRDGMAETSPRWWTAERVQQLRDLVYAGRRNDQIGKIMGVSEDAARRARQAHKIGRATGLSPEDMAELRRLAPLGIGGRAIARRLHIGPPRLQRAAREAGIRIERAPMVWKQPQPGQVWTVSQADRAHYRAEAAKKREATRDQAALTVDSLPLPDTQDPRGCRWIDGEGSTWRYCQATPTHPGASWCAHHRHIVAAPVAQPMAVAA